MVVTQRKKNIVKSVGKPTNKGFHCNNPSNGKSFTLDEVAKHRTPNDLWTIVDGKVYDVTDFVPRHPGGFHAIAMAGGQDISYLMQTSHQFNNKPWKVLESFYIGEAENNFVEYTIETPFYDEIREKVVEYFDKTKQDPKDPTFSIIVFITLSSLFAVGLWGFYNKIIWLAFLLGCVRALFGIHTMHACSHFAVTHSPFVWKWGDWFVFDILMGSSHWAWDYQHVVGHHQHTNVFQADPDLPYKHEGDMRRVVDQQKYKDMYKYQYLYLPPLYLLLALKVHVYDIMFLCGYKMNGNIVMTQSSFDWISLFLTKCFFFFYNFYVPLVWYQQTLWEFFVLFWVMELASGGWLAYCFQVNHISTNVLYCDMDHSKTTTAKEWAAIQVEGSVDYGHGSFIHLMLTGTLNYQVIHHLFPSISPNYYPVIAPMVMESAKKYGIKYQAHDNYYIAAREHLKELKRMGEAGQAAGFPDLG